MRRIRFVPQDKYAQENIDPPRPSKTIVPDWYKSGEVAISLKTGESSKPGDKDITGGLKSCVPFLDAMVSGYFICFWEDTYVRTTDKVEEWYPVKKNTYNDKYDKVVSHAVQMIDEREGIIGHTIPRPEGYCNNHMVFKGQWGFRLPRGWSLLLTQPLNHFDLPFFTTSGIIDSDEWWTGGNMPFFFKKNFEGIIPKDTPFAQVIPIKRSSWYSYTSEFSVSRTNYMSQKARSVPMGWYKKNMWVKKQYE